MTSCGGGRVRPETSDWVKKIYMGGGNPRTICTMEVIQMVAKINKDECVACGACVDVCPEAAITCDDVAVVDEKKCLDCGACVDECPNNAITME
jgi:ferredoxin